MPLVLLLLFSACGKTFRYKNKEMTIQAFSDMKAPAFVYDVEVVRHYLYELAKADKVETESDRKARDYYLHTPQHLLWIDRVGVDDRADSLLSWLHTVGELGFSERAFYVSAIEDDLRRMRQLDFIIDRDEINKVSARLEYRLTKSCFRYCYGQRFGFVNPYKIFNHLDVEKEDSVRHIVKYRGLFDIGMDLPDAGYAQTVMGRIIHDSIVGYLRQIQPNGAYYQQLRRMLTTASTDAERQRILCNMERSRWRLRQPMPDDGKYIVVNIPAYHLYAYGGDTVLNMRVACGARTTKTPLLTSALEWMEVNPQWVIPMSIVEKDVVRHIGDSAYFARNRYDVYERSTNRQIPIGSVTQATLLSGKYRVAQQSGSENSLGRIVFRFKNNFSVFLHYTSNPGVFSRKSRAVSHGCVRVQHPFELAQFVLDDPDEWLLDRIRISMDMQPQTERGLRYIETHRQETEHKLIGYVPVKPCVPLYIIYYTLWNDENGILQTWPDVYGYDEVVWTHLYPFLQ